MYDVLIIGSGAAGLSAALNAKENGSTVAVLSKTYPTHSQTVQAQGGINAVLYEDDDSVDIHVNDTYTASRGLADKENINFMCKNAKETILWLDKVGVPFTKNENSNIAQRKFGGTKKIRTCYSSDYTGLKIVHTLFDQCIKNDIEFINEHILLDFIIENDICAGVIALDIISGVVKEFKAKSTIIASGGYAGIYTNFTTNSFSNTADGLAVSLNANVNLSNIEFVQFHPTAINVGKDPAPLATEALRGEGCTLHNDAGERFMLKVHEDAELAPRDVVAKAIFEEVASGRGAWLDARQAVGAHFKDEFPTVYGYCEDAGFDPAKDMIPVIPAAHYSCGGIKVDENSSTTLKGLYAIGECSATGLHGANRLASNSLLEALVFAHRAALDCLKALQKPLPSDAFYKALPEWDGEGYSKKNTLDEVPVLRKKLQEIMTRSVGIFKSTQSLQQAEEKINDIYLEVHQFYNQNKLTNELCELRNMVSIAYLIIKQAQELNENKGVFYNHDYA